MPVRAHVTAKRLTAYAAPVQRLSKVVHATYDAFRFVRRLPRKSDTRERVHVGEEPLRPIAIVYLQQLDEGSWVLLQAFIVVLLNCGLVNSEIWALLGVLV